VGNMTSEVSDLIQTYKSDKRTHHNGEPWVLLNMISSSNGLATLNGLSGSLGGTADKALFKTLRSISDVIIVGYGTVRDEQYRPPQLTKEAIKQRESQGRSDLPVIAVISNRLNFDKEIPLFSSKGYRPVVVTSSSSPGINRTDLSSICDVFVSGEEKVDLKEAVTLLSSRFGKVVLVEGGPSLNTQFVKDDLFDELCITTSPHRSKDIHAPVVTTGESYGKGLMIEDRVIELDGFTFTRFLRSREENC